MRPLLPAAAVVLLAVAATPATAQRWGYPGAYSYGPIHDRSREGKVEVTRFLADSAAVQALGHGPVAVAAASNGPAGDEERATYEAAVIDRLAHVGYDTATRPGAEGQTVELTVQHAEIEPPEAPHKPVSGSMSVGVDSRGGRYAGLALGVDMRKPLPALISTRLDARIRDKASGTVLWEGHADIATREGDPKWTEQALAARLAGALFSGFPGKNGETIRG
jgi:hypothetical protein